MSAGARMIPSEVITRLVEDSYESFIQRVQTLVESAREQIFGAAGASLRVAVQGTYANHAIVVAEAADVPVRRVKFSVEADGSLRFVQSEPVVVPTYDAATLPDFVQAEARRAVDAMLAGDVAVAAARLESLLPLVEGAGSRSEAVVLATVREAVTVDSGWRAALTAQGPGVRAALVAVLEGSAPALPAKFSAATLTESDRARCRTALAAVAARYDAVLAAVSESAGALRGLGAEAAELVRLTEGLLRDLRGVRKVARDASRLVESVEGLAQTYEGLAGSLTDFEAAGLFVAKQAQRLAQGSR